MHAHPYREEAYIPEVRLFPEFVDGVEGINAAHHWYSGTLRDKTVFDRKAVAYARAILGGEDYVMTDGKVWYDRKGNVI